MDAIFPRHQPGDPNDTQVTIIDSKDSALHSEHVFRTRAGSLENALRRRSPDIKTRIIIVTYTAISSIDRMVVDALGRIFDIDPLIFQQHFDHRSLDRFPSYRHEAESFYSPLALLPSEQRARRCLRFGTDGWHYASAMFPRDKLNANNHSKATVVIWVRSHMPPRVWHSRIYPSFSAPPEHQSSQHNLIGAMYIDSLLAWTPDLVRIADEDRIQYVAPLVHLFLKEYYLHFQNLLDPKRLIDSGGVFGDPNRKLLKVRTLFRYVDETHREITSMLKDEATRVVVSVHSPVQVAIKDLDVLIEELKDVENYYDRLNREALINAQLREARNSTETAVSVARLTKLAFIFIPLSFVTSFFGMNVKQFGNGDINIWVFFASAAALICMTLTPFLDELVSGEIIICTVKLLFKSPYIGLCFFAFTLYNTHQTNMRFCEWGVFHYLSKGEQGQLQAPLSDRDWEEKFGWREGNMVQRFWTRRGRDIMLFIHEQERSPDWNKKGPRNRLLWPAKWWKFTDGKDSWT